MPEILRVANAPGDYDWCQFDEIYTGTAYRDENYVPNSVRLKDTDFEDAEIGIGIGYELDSEVDDLWVRWKWGCNDIGLYQYRDFGIWDANGDILADIKRSSYNNPRYVHVYGDVEETVLFSYDPQDGAFVEFVAHLEKTATDRIFTIYIDGAKVASVSTGIGSLGGGKFISATGMFSHNNGSTDYVYFSEGIVSDGVDLRNLRLAAFEQDAAGFYSDWTGNIASLVDGDKATGLTSDTDGDRSSVTTTYVGPSEGNIREVFVVGGAAHESGEPSEVVPFLRIGGTDYDGVAKAIAPVTVFAQSWDQNPATLADWTFADFSSIEIGVKAQDSA